VPSSDIPVWAWGLLVLLLVSCIVIDLVAHRGDRAGSRKTAVVWSVVWIGLSFAFAGFVAVRFGREAGEQFVAAYLLEKSLSLDNLFLFLVIFGALQIPPGEQHRVLTFGIIGALVTRLVFIFAGASAIRHWHEVTYLLGALLIATAIKMLVTRETAGNAPRAVGWLQRHLPWTPRLHAHRFFAREHGRRVVTPLFVALIAIELTDVLFALDSIPAAFAVTDDTFILYSSNVFAVLGLRALYIVLAHSLSGLRYLRFGLAGVLALAGIKMLAAAWVRIPPAISVVTIVSILGLSIVASLIARGRDRAALV